jgi:hypothetical protein
MNKRDDGELCREVIDSAKVNEIVVHVSSPGARSIRVVRFADLDAFIMSVTSAECAAAIKLDLQRLNVPLAPQGWRWLISLSDGAAKIELRRTSHCKGGPAS